MADVFEGAKEAKPNRVSWGKIGDYIIGYYTDKKLVQTQNGEKFVFELKGTSGSWHEETSALDENQNKIVKVAEDASVVEPGNFYSMFDRKLNAQMTLADFFKKIQTGQKVVIQMIDKQPSKVAGHAPYKTLKAASWQEFDPDMGASSEETISVEE